jgi:hypothetical protein
VKLSSGKQLLETLLELRILNRQISAKCGENTTGRARRAARTQQEGREERRERDKSSENTTGRARRAARTR